MFAGGCNTIHSGLNWPEVAISCSVGPLENQLRKRQVTKVEIQMEQNKQGRAKCFTTS